MKQSRISLAKLFDCLKQQKSFDRGFSWEPILYPHWKQLIPPRDLWVGPNDPAVHFLRWIFEWRSYLTLLCDMRQDASVLELGCNHGRTALSLVDYVHPPGKYEGLDIMPKQIQFAHNNIHSLYPHFNFTLADIHNSVYNPQGQLSAENFKFPYLDGSFDVAYAASLFTHLLPHAVTNYFKEARRVLRSGGKCLFSFFVLDNYMGTGSSACQLYEFDSHLGEFYGVAVNDPTIPEKLIAYSGTFIQEIASEAKLKVLRIIPGYWSKTHNINVNEQDLILLEAI